MYLFVYIYIEVCVLLEGDHSLFCSLWRTLPATHAHTPLWTEFWGLKGRAHWSFILGASRTRKADYWTSKVAEMASQSTNQGKGLNFAVKCMLNLSTCDPMKFKFSSPHTVSSFLMLRVVWVVELGRVCQWEMVRWDCRDPHTVSSFLMLRVVCVLLFETEHIKLRKSSSTKAKTTELCFLCFFCLVPTRLTFHRQSIDHKLMRKLSDVISLSLGKFLITIQQWDNWKMIYKWIRLEHKTIGPQNAFWIS